MNIPVTFAQRDGSDRFPVAVRVVSNVAPVQTVPGEPYRDRLVGLLRRCRLRLEQRRLEVLRLSLQ